MGFFSSVKKALSKRSPVALVKRSNPLSLPTPIHAAKRLFGAAHHKRPFDLARGRFRSPGHLFGTLGKKPSLDPVKDAAKHVRGDRVKHLRRTGPGRLFGRES